MNQPMRSLIPFVLVSSFILHPSSFLQADGGTVRVSEQAGPYRVTVFTAPTPFRAGPVDISVFVQDAQTGDPLPDVAIRIELTPAGQGHAALAYPATHQAATNQLFQAAVFELPAAGRWQVEVTLDGVRGQARVPLELEAAEPLPPWLAMAGWMGWPLVPILLYAIHEIRVARRPSRAGHRPAGPKSRV